MKKYFIAAALILTVNFAHAIRIKRGVDECGIVKIVYTNGNENELGTICGGDDTFETGDNEVAYIVVNGTVCYPGNVTAVELNGDTPAQVSSYATEADGIVYVINAVE